MSLVGSLEDLGLGDILQIITLSRKSGALLLRSDSGEGRVIFRDGLVCGARVKGRTPDLRRLLVDGGHLSEDDFESVRSEASEQGVPLASALSEEITPERFEGLRRECVEGAVLDMFGWETGEFSFEVGDDAPEDEFEVVLEAGINAQYLAMEGTRRSDEETRAPEVSPDDPASFADLAEEMESDEPPRDAFEAVALTTAEKLDAHDALESTTEEEVEEALEAAIRGASPEPESDGEITAVMERVTAEPETPEPATPEPAAPVSLGKLPPVVAVAPDLPVLEWLKRSLEGTFQRVHIFQKADLAVERLRQYTARADWPLVLVSPEVGDRLVARMQKQSPRSVVLWLGENEDAGSAHGSVACASAQDALCSAGPAPKLADDLRAGVLDALGQPNEAPAADANDSDEGDAGAEPAESAASSERLAEVRARLEDPETRGEVLNVVLEFASEQFERVALLAVREGEVQGIAGLGLEKAGGPDDPALREVQLGVDESRWLERVVEDRAVVRAAPEGVGDHELSARLGDALPEEAWLAPVISGDQVVAILYGDNLPDGGSPGETADLETALEQAGRVLEQAMEERARSGG